MNVNKKTLVYFNTNETNVYNLADGSLKFLWKEKIYFNETLLHAEMLKKIDDFLLRLGNMIDEVSNKTVRLYASGIFQDLSKEEQMQLCIHVFVNSNLYLNIIPKDLEEFYLKSCVKLYD